MKTILLSFLLVLAVLSQADAGPGRKPRKFTPAQINKTVRLERQIEPKPSGKVSKPGNYGGKLEKLLEKKGPGNSNLVQDVVTVSTMGESVNPFTVVGNGKTNLFAHPLLNTVAFVRRGGPGDPYGPDGKPGNRLYYDLNTHGGNEGFWQISKGPIYKNDAFPVTPTIKYAARYPQGLLWSPPGSTDTNTALFFSQVPVLDSTNGIWGGQALGWQKLTGDSLPKQTVSTSEAPNPLHYIGEGMDYNFANGKIYFIDPERDLLSGSTEYQNRIILYTMSYNSGTNDWDSTITDIPFPANQIMRASIAFGPDGQTGYIVVLATSSSYGISNFFAPFISKSSDAGNTWSPFYVLNQNMENSTEMDSILRYHWLGDWVHFDSDGYIRSAEENSTYSHRVEYSTNEDLDISVDKFNFCHILTGMVVAGFTDTLESSDPPSWRPRLGQWITDLIILDPSTFTGAVFGPTKSYQGCWGDCAGTENFTEGNRPQLSRNLDGSLIVACWFDTDTAVYPPVEGYENSNPDLWIEGVRAKKPGQYQLTTSRNKTKGSSAEGKMICGNISPYLLQEHGGDSSFIVPASAILLSDFQGGPSHWPVTHFYSHGIKISSRYDSMVYHVPLCTIGQPTNIEAAKETRNLQMNLSPNPTKTSFTATFTAPKPGEAFISITNSLGQIIETKTLQVYARETCIPFITSAYPSGIYFLNVSLGGQRVSSLFVKE